MATDRLTLGVAARLSRYLQVLTQAKKMGKSSISSQAISEYTNVNPTQIRRDLSGFGKFGKRGVGYDIDSLIEQIRKILRTSGQHNIALFGAGNLGQAIATLGRLRRPRLPHLGDLRRRSESKVGTRVGDIEVRHYDELHGGGGARTAIMVGVLAVPGGAAQQVADDLVAAGVKIIFNYSDALLIGALGRDRPHLEPGRGAALRPLLLPHVSRRRRGRRLPLTA